MRSVEHMRVYVFKCARLLIVFDDFIIIVEYKGKNETGQVWTFKSRKTATTHFEGGKI